MAKLSVKELFCWVLLPILIVRHVSGREMLLFEKEVLNHSDNNFCSIDSTSISRKFYSGNLLRYVLLTILTQYLPEHFPYCLVPSEGFWAILPKTDFECEFIQRLEQHDDLEWSTSSEEDNLSSCDRSHYTNFTCSLSPQLIYSVKIRYVFGGNATIRVIGTDGQCSFELKANNTPAMSDWADFLVENLKEQKVVIETIAIQPGDFILIDKIEVQARTLRTFTPFTKKSQQPVIASTGPQSTWT